MVAQWGAWGRCPTEHHAEAFVEFVVEVVTRDVVRGAVRRRDQGYCG